MLRSPRAAAQAHLDWFVPAARAAGDGVLWPSCLQHDGRRGSGEHLEAGVAKRCYRAIAAPGGSTLYWDLPLLAAARAAGHGAAARSYAETYLDRCTAPDGLPWWGNHAYYHFDHAAPVTFNGNQLPQPVSAGQDRFPLHELRPLAVDWELLAAWRPAIVERALTAIGAHHLVEAAAGRFNRHADGKPDLAFLEAGAVLVEGLAWLGARGDATAASRSRAVADFVAAAEAPSGLVPTTPASRRWDGETATSEVGPWALALLRAGGLSGDERFPAQALRELAAWQQAAWDETSGRFRGRIAVGDGSHRREPIPTPYMPALWSDPWRATYPNHDHPWAAALACLLAWQREGGERWRLALERWGRVIAGSLPARDGEGGYAEHYGRGIHFARAAALLTGEPAWTALAERLVDEAMGVLWAGERFRSHPFEDRCDAVDGLGFLCLALLVDDQTLAADPGAWPW